LPQPDESGVLSDYAGFDYDHARVIRNGGGGGGEVPEHGTWLSMV